MGPFPKSKNYEYILVIVDYVWVEAMRAELLMQRTPGRYLKK
jgi:hypothetical protein